MALSSNVYLLLDNFMAFGSNVYKMYMLLDNFMALGSNVYMLLDDFTALQQCVPVAQ